jgi:hypothetical protein
MSEAPQGELTPTETENILDQVVSNMEDAVVLDCVGGLNSITYREAILQYNRRLSSYKNLVNDILGVK